MENEGAAPRKIDLHTHTTASDGALSPSALVSLAAERGIGTLAVTDHDSAEALGEALPVAAEVGVRLITGVELGAYMLGAEVHMLGYFFDPEHPRMKQTLSELREGRAYRGRRMVEKLQELGLDVSWEQVQELAAGGAVGRPHVGRALIEKGYAVSIDDAFDKYLGRGRPAYIPRTQLTPTDCIALVHEAGGVAVLAHPTWIEGVELLLPRLAEAGLDGIETYYGLYGSETITWLEGLARQYDLVPTGGSDYHGQPGLAHADLGSVSVPVHYFEELEKRAGARAEG